MVAITNMALCLLPGRQTYFQTTSCILGNSYSNTLLVLLNSRVRLGRPTGYIDDEVSETTFDTQPEFRPARSALVFAQPDETVMDTPGQTMAEGRPSTQSEPGRASYSGDQRNTEWIRGRNTAMTNISEDTRTMVSMNMVNHENWEERHSGRVRLILLFLFSQNLNPISSLTAQQRKNMRLSKKKISATQYNLHPGFLPSP